MFRSRHPYYELFSQLIGSSITIEGVIGAGKTTLGLALEKYLNEIGLRAKFFPEFVNLDLLGQYLSNMNRYAYPFQMFMLLKRLEIYREAERFRETGGIAIIDRSLIGDLAFMLMQHTNGNITDQEKAVYESVFIQESPPCPGVCIYLQCTSRQAMDRIIKRGREGEADAYTLEYLENLANRYTQVFSQTQIVPLYLSEVNDLENVLERVIAHRMAHSIFHNV